MQVGEFLVCGAYGFIVQGVQICRFRAGGIQLGGVQWIQYTYAPQEDESLCDAPSKVLGCVFWHV